ncbi:MAG: zinc metallopeptidase [Tissierellia bacterium]|nr:zinc metallopeptidase [Tissierellia bacterium]
MFYYGPDYYISYLIFVLPALILAMFAQNKVKSTFNKYLRVSNNTGLTGAQVARLILDRNNLSNISVEYTKGHLTDHYDPRKKVIKLSSDVYGGSSIAAMSVAAHEVGHALQHSENYLPLVVRNTIVPVVNLGSNLVWLLILLGFLIDYFFIELGIFVFLGVVIFHLITLPVEFNASRRALVQLENGISPIENIEPAKQVLSAAALTYVASAMVAIGELARIIFMTRNRRN